MSKKPVVLFVSMMPGARELKLATGLLRHGWNPMLLAGSKPLFSIQGPFAHIDHYKTIPEAVAKAKALSPTICHLILYYDYALGRAFIDNFQSIPIVIDPYDTIYGMFTDDFLKANQWLGRGIPVEKYCFQHADGICCKHLETQVYKRNMGLKVSKRILVHDGCYPRDLYKKKSVKSVSDIHVVYCGGVFPEKCNPEADWVEGFLWVAKKIVVAGMHFHLYPNKRNIRDFEQDFSDYIDLEEASKGRFHLHTPVPHEKLVDEISQYDIGFLSQTYQNGIGPERTYYKSIYCMASKTYDYVEAGLPIMLNSHYKFTAHFLKNLGIYIPPDKTIYSDSPSFDIEELEIANRHIDRAIEYFDIYKQTARLSEFYYNLIDDKRSNCQYLGPSKKTISNENNHIASYPEAQWRDKIDAVKIDQIEKETGGASMTGEEAGEQRPSIFSVETVLGCDLACPECALGGGFINREKGWMRFEQFKIIADKISPFCKLLFLHLWGEPMLNKDIFKMIEYASAFTRTNISTNGKAMTAEKAEQLIRSAVTDVIFSIDGVSQEVYEKYRVGGDVEKAIEALRMVQHFNLKYGNKVHIMPQFIVMKHNQHEMDEFQKLCESLQLIPSFKSPYIRNQRSRFAVSDDPQFIRPHFPDIKSLRGAMRECGSVRNVFNILLDGSVVPCCHDYGKFAFFGNIFQQDVMEIWNDDKFRNFRWRVMSGNAPKFCIDKCMSYYLANVNVDKMDKSQLSIKTVGKNTISSKRSLKINLCSGSNKIGGFVNIDFLPGADIVIDLERDLLPFAENSVDVVVCNSAINYFTRNRAQQIINDVYRVLKPDGIVRFGTQDLRILVEKYVNNDNEFYFQKLPDGNERFPGATIGDKLNEFFYGFGVRDKHCKYLYDYESLKVLFQNAGYQSIEQKKYRESLIPEIEMIDNRPNQMFFLEAVKNPADSDLADHKDITGPEIIKSIIPEQTYASLNHKFENIRATAFKKWENGELEKAWQFFLQALDLKPDDAQTVIHCIEIFENLGRYEDILKVCKNYLMTKPGDQHIKKIYDNVQDRIKIDIPDPKEVAQAQAEMAKLSFHENDVHSDEKHLGACLQWLTRAQQAHRGGGVSSIYRLETKRWDVDYPETTGYIIPTFLSYYKYSGDKTYLRSAIEMGDWEVDIQAPDGGVGEPFGVYGLQPRVFNTGQVLFGWIALYKETGDSKYFDAARKAANWIVENQDPDGKWSRNTYMGPKAYHSRVAWGLLELYSISNEKKWQIAANNAINWVLSLGHQNGWFGKNSLTAPDKPWTHLIGYVLVGLLESCMLDSKNINPTRLLSLLANAAKNIANYCIKSAEITGNGHPKTLPGTFDQNWMSNDNWTCVTGNAQIAFFLHKMSALFNDDSLIIAANHLIKDLKSIHFVDGISDSNLYGGLPGSYPIGGGYASYAIPNWGVKFFADTLLLRIASFSDKKYLG